MVKVAPSILSADFAKMGEEVKRIEAAGADWVHIDVMDGHFVPNISMGPAVVSSLRRASELFFDVHLMISDPEKYAKVFAEAGADLICFHVEAVKDPARAIRLIKSFGKKVGLAVKPGTPASSVFSFLGELDLVLVMSVEPGFSGQVFMPVAVEKIRELKREIRSRGLGVEIEVDGGINPETAKLVRSAGADVIVAASAIFKEKDYAVVVKKLRGV